MGLLIEKAWPYLAGAVFSLGWYFFLGARFPTHVDNLMLATGTTSAVIVGFLATAKAIVLGLTNTPTFRALKDTGYSTILFRYFFEAILLGMLLLIFSIAGFFLPDNGSQPQAPLWFAATWMFLGTCSVFGYLRVVRVLFKLVAKA